MNSNWSNSLETLNSGKKIGDFFVPCDLEIWWMNFKKIIGHLFYAASSFVNHSIAFSKSKLELQSRNDQFGSKAMIFLAVWPWNLTDYLEKTQGTSSMLLQALCIILQPLVNSNWSYSPVTPNLGQNWRFFLAVWPWNLTDDLEKQ